MKFGTMVGLLVAALWHTRPAYATPDNGPKIAGHLLAYTTKAICSAPAARPPCNPGETHLNTHGNLNTSYNLYLVVVDADSAAGLAGAVFGIDYNGTAGAGMDTFSWILCADAEYSGGPQGVSWPASGSGNVIVWDKDTHCQKAPASGDANYGVTAVLGAIYVYAYSADLFSIEPRGYANTPDLSVGTCTTQEVSLNFPSGVGKVGFGTTQGVDPCQ
jgi:hypothetical protein